MAGCGSKTGLLVPERDAATETEAGLCVRSRSTLEQRTPEILFVLDRSRSMLFDLEGGIADPGEVRRWDLLGDALVTALRVREGALGYGVLLFPNTPDPINTIQDACRVGGTASVPIGTTNVDRIARLFTSETPAGGTPTAGALRRARDLIASPRPGVQRFVILATDGAPNCNGEPPAPPPLCLCTSNDPEVCNDPVIGPFQCLDDSAAVDAVSALSSEDGVPVYVIGIDDPRRPEFGATLDAMAVAGMRPRMGSGRSFYDVREPEDLDEAVETITASIERCVYYLTDRLDSSEIVSLQLDGELLPQDPSQTDGWAVTNGPAGEISLFGPTCDRVDAAEGTLTAFTGCR